MLDIKFIRNNIEIVKRAIKDKCVELNLEVLLATDKELLENKKILQEKLTKINLIAKQIVNLNEIERAVKIREGREIGDEIGGLEKIVKELEINFEKMMLLVPNIPAQFAPIGESEEDNVEIKRVGAIPSFNFKPKNHIELLHLNNWAEFERATKIAGSRGYILKGDLFQIENELHQLAWRKLKARGFDLMGVPSLARDFAFTGTGHFPTGKEQMYFLERDELYLTGTSEIVLNSYHKDEILKEDELPKLYGGYGPCFRREAGSAGRDVGGLMRVHQFTKTEAYIICKNSLEESLKWHQLLIDVAEEMLIDLELPYRIVECCTGDMGLGKYRMNDIEVWIPSENRYRESHSGSTLLDWQARRTNLRYRNREGKVEYCHTLNCTVIATPRILIPLLEIHQQEDGSVKFPRVLEPK